MAENQRKEGVAPANGAAPASLRERMSGMLQDGGHDDDQRDHHEQAIEWMIPQWERYTIVIRLKRREYYNNRKPCYP